MAFLLCYPNPLRDPCVSVSLVSFSSHTPSRRPSPTSTHHSSLPSPQSCRFPIPFNSHYSALVGPPVLTPRPFHPHPSLSSLYVSRTPSRTTSLLRKETSSTGESSHDVTNGPSTLPVTFRGGDPHHKSHDGTTEFISGVVRNKVRVG